VSWEGEMGEGGREAEREGEREGGREEREGEGEEGEEGEREGENGEMEDNLEASKGQGLTDICNQDQKASKRSTREDILRPMIRNDCREALQMLPDPLHITHLLPPRSTLGNPPRTSTVLPTMVSLPAVRPVELVEGTCKEERMCCAEDASNGAEAMAVLEERNGLAVDQVRHLT
jgi:hypothetical protein